MVDVVPNHMGDQAKKFFFAILCYVKLMNNLGQLQL